MLRHFYMAGSLKLTPALSEALEAGIAARNEKVAGGPQKGSKNDDGVASALLTESGERMRDIVSRLG
jgi:hypothetical protein